MNKFHAIIKKTIGGPVIMVVLNWFNKSSGNLKFKYDVIDTNWVDVESIIYIVIMNYEKEKKLYWLDCIDANSLDEFVTNKTL
jgi:hypothetical protein